MRLCVEASEPPALLRALEQHSPDPVDQRWCRLACLLENETGRSIPAAERIPNGVRKAMREALMMHNCDVKMLHSMMPMLLELPCDVATEVVKHFRQRGRGVVNPVAWITAAVATRRCGDANDRLSMHKAGPKQPAHPPPGSEQVCGWRGGVLLLLFVAVVRVV